MLTLHGLWIALAAEGLLILAALGGLVGLRVYLSARARRVDAVVRALEPVLHRWLVEDADVVAVLRRCQPYVAFRSLARLAPGTLAFERQQALAPHLRREPWVNRPLARARSRLWWHRFDAARMLSIVGVNGDAPLIENLLGDPHPAVRLVAIDAAARLGGGLSRWSSTDCRRVRTLCSSTSSRRWRVIRAWSPRRL